MSLQAELLTAFEATAETALNNYLRLDPVTLQRLARFNDKVIAIEMRGTGTTLYLLPGNGRINVMSTYAGEPDTIISGTPLSLAELRFGDTHRTLFSGDVTIRGDVETGQAFKRLLDNMEIDWEEHLSRLTGDIAAHHLGDLVRGLGTWGQQAMRTLGSNLAEYLQQESRSLATAEEVTEFGDAVDRLRDDSERLQSRINLLQQHLQSQTKGS